MGLRPTDAAGPRHHRAVRPARAAPARRWRLRCWPARSASSSTGSTWPGSSTSTSARPRSTCASCSTSCERAPVLLLFDEADALFGKRSQVNDAHDRYANIEIDYLLQRMEQFDGLAILATNRKGDLDKAFMRRLRFIIEFAPPSRAGARAAVATGARGRPRRQRAHADRAAGLGAARPGARPDWGGIKSAALAAAFLARSDGTTITQRHVLAAARRELEKQGVVVRTGQRRSQRTEPAAADVAPSALPGHSWPGRPHRAAGAAAWPGSTRTPRARWRAWWPRDWPPASSGPRGSAGLDHLAIDVDGERRRQPRHRRAGPADRGRDRPGAGPRPHHRRPGRRDGAMSGFVMKGALVEFMPTFLPAAHAQRDRLPVQPGDADPHLDPAGAPSGAAGDRDEQPAGGAGHARRDVLLHAGDGRQRRDRRRQSRRPRRSPRRAGVYSRLAALEMLLYPTGTSNALVGAVSAAIGSRARRLQLGADAARSPQSVIPVTLFIWGPGRIVPVRVTASDHHREALRRAR